MIQLERTSAGEALTLGVAVVRRLHYAVLPMPFQLLAFNDNVVSVTVTERDPDTDEQTAVNDATPHLAVCNLAGVTVEDITIASPPVITSVGHGLTTGDQVVVDQTQGVEGAVGVHTVTVIDPDTFSLDGATTTGAFEGQGVYHLVLDDLTIPYVATSDGRYAMTYNPGALLLRGSKLAGFIYDAGLYAGQVWRKQEVTVR